MESNAIYTTSDAGLSRFFGKDLWPCWYGSGTFSSHFLSDALPSLACFCQYSHELFLGLHGSPLFRVWFGLFG